MRCHAFQGANCHTFDVINCAGRSTNGSSSLATGAVSQLFPALTRVTGSIIAIIVSIIGALILILILLLLLKRRRSKPGPAPVALSVWIFLKHGRVVTVVCAGLPRRCWQGHACGRGLLGQPHVWHDARAGRWQLRRRQYVLAQFLPAVSPSCADAPTQAVYTGVASRDGGYMTVVRPAPAGNATNPMYAASVPVDNYEGVSKKAVWRIALLHFC